MKSNDGQLTTELRSFIDHHAEGWSHDEWVNLINQLSDAGYDTADPDLIGIALERERLSAELERAEITGLGPKRREALAERFTTMWNLKHATTDEIVAVSRIPKDIAERIKAALQ